MLHLIGFIIIGFIVGLFARALKPGDDRMSIGKTTVLGVIGALLAGWFGRVVGWYGEGEGAGLLMSTLGAIVVLSIYYMVTSRKRLV
jgi:uncharacterized membrane protein YeaQ/YmgE (transglycosylase-associated protein family)